MRVSAKKIICLLVSLALMLPTLSGIGFAAVTENVLFSYDFSELSAGQNIPVTTSNATVFSGKHANETALIQAQEDNGNLCAVYSNVGTANSGPKLIKRTNVSRLSNLTVRFRAKGDKPMQIALYSGTTNHSVYNYTLDKQSWQNMEIRFDFINDTFDVYLGDKAVAEKKPVPALENRGAVEVRFGVGIAPGEKVYLDDVVFTTTDQVTPEAIFLSTANEAPATEKKVAELKNITTPAPALILPDGANIILKDDMEAHPGKLDTVQWTTIMGNGTYVNVVSAAGNKIAAFTNTDTTTHGPRLEKTLGASDLKKVYTELYYYKDSSVLNVNISDENAKNATVFMLNKGAKAEQEGWNHLKVEIDIEQKVATSFVNGTQVNSAKLDVLSGDTANWIVRISCGLNQNEATYMDNCVIYTTDSLGDQMFSYDGSLNFDKVFPTAPSGMLDIMRDHPRLIVTDWDVIREKINSDYYCARWYKDIKSQANALCTSEPTEYKVNVRGNVNDSSHAIKRAIMILAFAAAVENSTLYKDRMLKEIRYARDNWPDWGEAIYIVFSHVLMGHAIAYDWCYDLLTEAERAEVLSVLMEDGVTRVVRGYEGRMSSGSVLTQQHNQNMVGTASNLFAAIAIADEYPQVADYIIEKARGSIDYTLVEIGPDGSFSEPMEYWGYGVGHLFKYQMALESAIQDGATVPAHLDISATPGLDKAADFPIYYQGPVGFFNYGDSTSKKSISPVYIYLAGKYNKPQYTWFLLQEEDKDAQMRLKGKDAAIAIAYYDPEKISAGDFSLDKSYTSTEKFGVNGMSFRSSWNDPDVLFAAMQGGDNESFHQHYSLGTFIIEYGGERFLHQTGKHAAGGGTYNFTQKGDHDSFYHIRTEGNNTLLINPDVTPGQNKVAMAVLEKFEAGQNTSYGILNMTQTHNDYESAKRGMMITDNRRKIIVQDEVVAVKPSEFYWFAHTDAGVVIADDGKTALMEKNGQRIFVRIAAGPPQARFSLMAVQPLPTSPNPESQRGEFLPAYSGDKKLTIHMTDVKEMTLSVEFIALKEGEGIPNITKAAVPMAQWKADTAAEKPLVQTLGGSVALRIDSPVAFAAGQRTFVDTNNTAVVPFTENGRTLVPVRFISENFGATVDWNAVEEIVTVRYKNKVISLKLGDNVMDVDGNKVILDVPATTYNSRTLIPLRALVEALGKYVFWDDRGLIIISDDAASYTENALVSLDRMLSQRVFAGEQELVKFNPEITDYYVEAKEAQNVTVLQMGAAVEGIVAQGNPATISMNDKVYNIHFTENPFLGSRYVANTITDFFVTAAGQMEAPEADPIIPVQNVESSIDWGMYVKSGSIDGIINDQIVNRWTGNGEQWIYYDLGSVQSVHSFALATVNSHTRTFTLDIDVSQDGLNWTPVKTGAETIMSPMPTIFELGDIQARYVRLYARKASSGNYSSYAEVRFYKNHADEQLDWATWNDRFNLNVAAGKVGDNILLNMSAKNTFGNNVDLSQYKVTYESRNPEIATVDAYGKVTLISKGVATIVVKAESFGMMTQSTTILVGAE